MELKEGMYAKTKRKGIIKINEVIDNGVITYEDDLGREWEEETGRKVIRYIDKDGWNKGIDESEILKASHNIIDLIEVGDYVNGGQVREKTKEYIRISGGKYLWEYLEKEEDIKSIVTKEQFESMSYKVDDAK